MPRYWPTSRRNLRKIGRYVSPREQSCGVRMQIISFTEAKDKGLPRFFTGVPCMRGHIVERYVSSRGCVDCHRNYKRAPTKLTSALPGAIEKRLAEVEDRLARVERIKAIPTHEDPKPTAKTKVEVDPNRRNGIKRPSEGTKCRTVWDAMDTVVAKGESPSAKLARALAEVAGWNVNNTVNEFYNWRRFHGIQGREAA